MDRFREIVRRLEPHQRCVQGTSGSYRTQPVGHCFFGVPPDALYGREPLGDVPPDATGFHFCLGSEQFELVEAFAESPFPAQTTSLVVGSSSYAQGGGLDYSELVTALARTRFDGLRQLALGAWELFSNSHCLLGTLGDVTDLLSATPSLETLELNGRFELRASLDLPHLRSLDVVLEDPTTRSHAGPIDQQTLDHLLASRFPELEVLNLSLTIDAPHPPYRLCDEFLEGRCTPALKRLEVDGLFAPEEGLRLVESALVRTRAPRLFLDEMEDE